MELEAARNRADTLETRVIQLTQALDAAQADLGRDEGIFKRKLAEIADLHGRLTEAVEQNEILREALAETEAEIHAVEARSSKTVAQLKRQVAEQEQAIERLRAGAKAPLGGASASARGADSGRLHASATDLAASGGNMFRSLGDGSGDDTDGKGDSSSSDDNEGVAEYPAGEDGGGDNDNDNGDDSDDEDAAALQSVDVELTRVRERNAALESSLAQVEEEKVRHNSRPWRVSHPPRLTICVATAAAGIVSTGYRGDQGTA